MHSTYRSLIGDISLGPLVGMLLHRATFREALPEPEVRPHQDALGFLHVLFPLALQIITHEADFDDMDDTVDEKGELIPQQQEEVKRRPVWLRGLLARFYIPSASGLSTKLLDAVDSDDFEDVDLRQHEPRRQRFAAQRFVPSLRAFIFAVVFFALGLGIGCGLGLSVPYYGSFLQVLSNLVDNTPTYNDHGIPDTLPIVPSTQLVNNAELDLKTDFIISRTPTVREYEFNISHALAAPDGVYKPMILANGQSPGPLIEANTGDTLRIKVNNLMPNTTTSIHWHGINQYNSTWMDGVAGISQCGIPAGGGSWTYEFTLVDQRGTYWWHAHTGVQFTDGLFGPIVCQNVMLVRREAEEFYILNKKLGCPRPG